MPSPAPNQLALLKTNRFLPLFITQFFGAFMDNLYKNALVVLILYGMSGKLDADPKLLTTLAAAVFIFPFLIFSAIAGKLADMTPKDRIMRLVKIFEIGIAGLGTISLFLESIPLSFLTLFALGTHSAFFAPCKYSILPQHLHQSELIGGNAVINTGTFLAILFGTISGTMLMTLPHGAAYVSLAMFAVSIIGYISSVKIPLAPPPQPYKKFPLNPFKENWELLHFAYAYDKKITMAILGKAWFFFIGSLFLAQFANYTHDTIHGSEAVLTFFLFLFSVGIGVGGLLNNRILKGKISTHLVPLAGFAISAFSIDLYFASDALKQPETFLTFAEFLSLPQSWRIIADLFLVSASGGLFLIPLSAYIQDNAPESDRARIIAASSVSDSIFIILSALLSAALIGYGMAVPTLFLTFGLLNIAATLIFFRSFQGKPPK
jgi:hypothetical protein